MSSLYQMNHGLPGIGINGLQGETGEKGNSVYFGYINNFFDGVKINLDDYVYIAKRISNNFKQWENDVMYLNQHLQDPAVTDPMYKILNPSIGYSYYYTGVTHDYNSRYCDPTIQDTSTVDYCKIDFSNDSQLMSVMLSSADGNAVTFNYSQSVYPFIDDANSTVDNTLKSISVTYQQHTYTYTELYDFESDNEKMVLKDYEKVRIVRHPSGDPLITYDSDDAAYLAYQYDADMQDFNNNWVYDSKPVSAAYDKIMGYLNASLNIIDEETPITAVREIIEYRKDEHSYLRLLTETNLFESVYTPADTSLYRRIAEGDCLDDNKEVLEFDPNQYFKSSIILPSRIYTGDAQDNYADDRYAYYGVANNRLFFNNINKDYTYKTLNPAGFNILSIYDEAGDALEKYQSIMTAFQNQTRVDISTGENSIIHYQMHESQIEIIPTTLKDMYKAGDVLYFYIDEGSLTKYADHMVVLSEDMLKCTKQQLIKYAQTTDPFNIRYFDEYNNRIISDAGIIAVKNTVNSAIDRYYTKSEAAIISRHSNAGLILANNVSAASIGIMEYVVESSDSSVYNMGLMLDTVNSSIYVQSDNVKVDNVYVNISSSINAEKRSILYDDNIVLKDNFLVPVKALKAYNDNTGQAYLGTYLYACDYFYSTLDMSSYQYGYDVMDENMTVIQQSQSNTDSLEMFFPVYLGDTKFFIITWAANATGIKFFSRMMQVDTDSIMGTTGMPKVTCQLITYCNIKEIGTDRQFVRTDLPEKPVTYKLVGSMTSEKCTDVSIIFNQTTENYVLKQILFNHNYIGQGQSKSVNDWSVITHGNAENVYSLSVNSNIPGYDDYEHYVHSSSLGSSYNDDCELFADIAAGKDRVSSNSRSVLATAVYYDQNENNILIYKDTSCTYYYRPLSEEYRVIDYYNNDITEITEVYYNTLNCTDVIIRFLKDYDIFTELKYYMVSRQIIDEPTDFYILTNPLNFRDVTHDLTILDPPLYYYNIKIVQPGFNDTRDVPDITLHMHNDMIDMQNYNTLENNVLCNQFITYMDINVENFNKTWGQFTDGNTDITMSFDIENIKSDINWQKRNSGKDTISNRTTMKFLFDDIMDPSEGIPDTDNYVLLHPSFVKTSADLIYVSNNESTYINPDYTINVSTVMVNRESAADISTYNIDDMKYIILDSSIVDYCKDPLKIDTGVQEHIKIHFDNIHIGDLSDNTLHLKLLYEQGNPVISNLFLQFAVTNVVIDVSNMYGNSSFFAHVPDNITQPDSYVHRLISYNDNTDYGFTYMSEPLDVFVNPMSYTMCPVDHEEEITNMQGDLYKSGSYQQIASSFKFYDAYRYDESRLTDISGSDIRNNRCMSWSPAKLKKSYLQDNIQNIAMTPDNTLNNISNINIFKRLCDNKILTNIPEQYNYIAISYKGTIMQPKYRDGNYSFYYNTMQFELSKYNQWAVHQPVYVNDIKTINVRDNDLFDAIGTWNQVYVSQRQYSSENTFTGVISMYGNGYTQLVDSYDTGQYTDTVLSLAETKSQSDVYIYNSEVYNDIINNNVTESQPENGHYYRTFLYDLNFDYEFSVNNMETYNYQIVSDFDNLINYARKQVPEGQEIPKIIAKYSDKYDKLVNKNNLMIPYSLLYKLYPRICYNIDNQNLNVLMLRMPTIQSDSAVDTFGNYGLNRKYFIEEDTNLF